MNLKSNGLGLSKIVRLELENGHFEGTVESGRCWVKAADVWSKVADVKAADVESKRPMLGPKWPMFGLKQPMFHRPLFWPKVADVV